jgi:hypothetical protein
MVFNSNHMLYLSVTSIKVYYERKNLDLWICIMSMFELFGV